MPLHYREIVIQTYLGGRGPNRIFRSPAFRRGSEKCGSALAQEKKKRWSRRVVPRHALHRDELGGGVCLAKVRNSNLAVTQE
jgi:hypothetical protein